MLQFSRAIYRELSPAIERPASREHVLAACESAMERLRCDRRYFARPARRLFNDIRFCFPISAQPRVWTVVSTYVAAAESYLDSLPAGLDGDGEPLRCQATTRQGSACRREPLPHNGLCPSHQHLAEPEHPALV
jgi:hypothetical protein